MEEAGKLEVWDEFEDWWLKCAPSHPEVRAFRNSKTGGSSEHRPAQMAQMTFRVMVDEGPTQTCGNEDMCAAVCCNELSRVRSF